MVLPSSGVGPFDAIDLHRLPIVLRSTQECIPTAIATRFEATFCA